MEVTPGSQEALPPVKAIVFDFDGVIVRRSEFFKREGWEHLFRDDPRAWELFEKAEQKYGQGRGGDRFDILRFVYTELYPDEKSETIDERVMDAAQKFDDFVQERIRKTGVDPIDLAVLQRLAKRFALYVNSATPVEALERTIEQLGLKSLFKGVLGRPRSKPENFKNVASQEGISAAEILFVGDGMSDAKAAVDAECRFLGYRNDWNQWTEGEQTFPVIRSLEDIENWVH